MGGRRGTGFEDSPLKSYPRVVGAAPLWIALLLSVNTPKAVNLAPTLPVPSPNFLAPLPVRPVPWRAPWLVPDPSRRYPHGGGGGHSSRAGACHGGGHR
jgi:hypothetical protein